MRKENQTEIMTPEIAEISRRVTRYEALLERLNTALSAAAPDAEALSSAEAAAEALRGYYGSDDWKRDFAADEAGLLPKDLKRGVLSEDGIYNALEAWRDRSGNPGMPIETARLLLRRMEAADLDLVFRLYSDEEILRFSPFDTMDRAAAEAHLERILQEWEAPAPRNLEYTVLRKQDQEKIGRCHIELDPETDTAMVGFHLLQPYWRHGYAAEICRKLMEYSFETLGVHRVNALCNPDNLGSRKVLEACGLRLEAHFRKKCRYVKNGEISWQDELQYAILREEWEQLRKEKARREKPC